MFFIAKLVKCSNNDTEECLQRGKNMRYTKRMSLFFVALLVLFSSCGLQGPKDIKICLFGADTAKTWNIWAWNKSTGKNYSSRSWPGGDIQLTGSENGYIFGSLTTETSGDLGILFVSSSGSPKTDDISVPVSVLEDNDTLYFVYNKNTYYTKLEDLMNIQSAEVTASGGNTIVAVIYGITSAAAADFTVTANDGTALTVTDATISGSNVTLTITGGAITKTPYYVTYNGIKTTASLSVDLIDNELSYSGSDLGTTFTSLSSVTFKTWAPSASNVQLLLFTDSSSLSQSPASTVDMARDTNGVWSANGVVCTSYKYYKFRITSQFGTNDISDIWASSCSADSVASQIVNINESSDAKPSNSSETYDGTSGNYKNPWTGTNYTQAVVYEMHIRDWSRAFVTDSTGKYLDLANASLFIGHLKDLGVTHVQILPTFDYAEKNADTKYNWGYNPYHYNVPEGRYVTEGYTDGTQAVKEFRTLVQKLHDAGIAVNMDVVYNHTSGTGKDSLYDMTVPYYFYRTNDTSYSNGSGCGNEIATNHKMVRKYVIDSLKHWMLDYHINGFRFDLMGCTETSTMKEIYEALSAIDPNVMVYGEPWTGGTSAVESGVSKNLIDSCASGTSVNGVACFNDDFRNAIKGGEFGGFNKGQVQGSFADSTIVSGLLGSKYFTGRVGRSLNYCECHDNYTLFDKLAISYLNRTSFSGDLFNAIGSAGLNAVKAQDKLCAAYVLLAQGTPFINGGQEFLRTKKGNDNSYNAGDSTNGIDIAMKNTYSDVYNTYKSLIALRKNYTAFTGATSTSAVTLKDGVTKYTATGDNGTFCVLFNATGSNYSLSQSVSGCVVSLNESNGSYSVSGSSTSTSSVPAKEFVIVKTQ